MPSYSLSKFSRIIIQTSNKLSKFNQFQVIPNILFKSMSSSEAKSRPGEGSNPIQLYSLATPNGHKVAIFLEEAELKYDAHTVNITKGDQFTDWFKEVNPNSKIPAIHDKESGMKVFESGAILLYLAEKTGKFLPKDLKKRFEVIEWVFWQMAGFGPMLGNMGHFHKYAKEDVPYGKERYMTESKRLFAVLEKQLEGKEYVCGEYSIADMAIFPWARGVDKFYGLLDKMGDIPNVKKYIERMEAKPAVQRALKVTPFA
jgi:GST-like protein